MGTFLLVFGSVVAGALVVFFAIAIVSAGRGADVEMELQAKNYEIEGLRNENLELVTENLKLGKMLGLGNVVPFNKDDYKKITEIVKLTNVENIQELKGSIA